MAARNRKRMIFDLPAETQMAIRLRAVKNQGTTTGVIVRAMEIAFPQDVEEARQSVDANRPRVERRP